MDIWLRLIEVAKRYSIRINAQKTKVMTTTAESVNIKVMDELLEQIDSFVYLGADVSACGEDVGKM